MARSRAIFPASRGRHPNRSGASMSGTLAMWRESLTHQIMAERQKQLVSNRAMDLYANDAMAHGLLEGLAVDAVGIGLTPLPRPDAEALGLSPEWARTFQKTGLKLFERWGLDPRGYSDATGRLSFYGLQAFTYFSWKLDGIGLAQVVSRKDQGRPLSLALLPIDSGRLVTPTTREKGEIYDGIEIDRDGRPVAAWIRKPSAPAPELGTRPGDCDRVEVYDPKTGLPKLLLVCDVRNIAEYRQDSCLSPMLKEIRDNNDFVDAALVRTLLSNLFVLFVQRAGGVGQAGPALSWEERILELEKGTILEGGPNEIPTFLGNDAPGPNFELMFEAIIKRLGMATGRGPENVSREYKASYSASRASMIQAAKFDQFEHGVLNMRLNQPAWTWMVYEAAARGLVPVRSIKHFLDNMYDYARCDWLPQPTAQIDPEKAAKADRIALGSRTKSLAGVYGERGKDWRAELRQIAEERKFVKELEAEYGISLNPEKDLEKDLEAENGQAGNDGD